MELIDYLNQHFLTRAQLLAAGGITSDRLDTLTAAGSMPRPSYRIRFGIRCASFFGEHLLDRASAPFAPHERARSARHRYVDAMRRRYGLPTP